MMRTTRRDLVVMGSFLVGGVATLLCALSDATTWALGLLGLLVAAVGAVSRMEFAARRQDFQFQRSETRALQAAVRGLQQTTRLAHDAHRRSISELHAESLGRFQNVQEQLNKGFRSTRHDAHLISDMKADISGDMTALRSEFRGLRVGQQLLSQTTAGTKLELQASLAATLALADDLQGLHQLFGRYMPLAPLPSLADSSLRASGAFFVANLIEHRRPALVWHRGSLASALWIAHAIRRNGQGAVVFEVSTEDQATQASEMIDANGLGEWAQVRGKGDPSDASPDDSETGFGSGARVDLLVVDPLGLGARAEAKQDMTFDLDRMLADESIVVVAGADTPDIKQTLRDWRDANSSITDLTAPRPDIAVLSMQAPPAGNGN